MNIITINKKLIPPPQDISHHLSGQLLDTLSSCGPKKVVQEPPPPHLNTDAAANQPVRDLCKQVECIGNDLHSLSSFTIIENLDFLCDPPLK